MQISRARENSNDRLEIIQMIIIEVNIIKLIIPSCNQLYHYKMNIEYFVIGNNGHKKVGSDCKNEWNYNVSLHVDTHVGTNFYSHSVGFTTHWLPKKKKRRRSVTNKSIFVARANIFNLTLKIMYVCTLNRSAYLSILNFLKWVLSFNISLHRKSTRFWIYKTPIFCKYAANVNWFHYRVISGLGIPENMEEKRKEISLVSSLKVKRGMDSEGVLSHTELYLFTTTAINEFTNPFPNHFLH